LITAVSKIVHTWPRSKLNSGQNGKDGEK